ncbi:MAG: twin-arginine translocation signal domain-containing protein [Nitrosomonas sp.]|nr:twin-arginine translocation signal domain-containing protein [Nitrosomonas sp.]
MLISRRKFLGMAGATTLVATCSPNPLLGQTLQKFSAVNYGTFST